MCFNCAIPIVTISIFFLRINCDVISAAIISLFINFSNCSLFTSLEDTSIFIISFFQLQHYVHLAFQMLVKNFLFETLFVYRIHYQV